MYIKIYRIYCVHNQIYTLNPHTAFTQQTLSTSGNPLSFIVFPSRFAMCIISLLLFSTSPSNRTNSKVIGPGCIHVAQVAVAPDRRGSGIANAMLQDVLARASADGFAKVSLLVGEHNAGARRIYDGLGFKETAHFVSAGSPAAQPTRR